MAAGSDWFAIEEVTFSSMEAAWVQNSDTAAFAVVPEALELELELDDDEDVLSEPPHAVSRATAAATESPLRQTVRVRRMLLRLTARWASQNPHG
jgi:hypothetical protein